MIQPPEESSPRHALAWFCIRSQPKHEHIAAAHLAKDQDFAVFLPRIRFKRATRRGPVWFAGARIRDEDERKQQESNDHEKCGMYIS